MEGVDSDSAIGSVTSNPSFEQKYGDLHNCFFEEPLPYPGPIPPKLSEFGSEEEEPFVEKDICREERQCASELHWGKRNPRSCKHMHRAAQTLVDMKSGKPNFSSSPNLRDRNMRQVQFLFEKMLTDSDVVCKRMVLPKEADIHLADVAQIGTTARIVMEDFDTGQSWKFGYRLWIHGKKIMHILQNTGGLTKAHKLQVGDLICFYKDSQGNYVVQGGFFPQWGLMRSGSKRPRVTN